MLANQILSIRPLTTYSGTLYGILYAQIHNSQDGRRSRSCQLSLIGVLGLYEDNFDASVILGPLNDTQKAGCGFKP